MKASFVFAGDSRFLVRWSGTTMPKLEKEIEELLACYGLECTDIGYDYEARERELVFRPKRKEDE